MEGSSLLLAALAYYAIETTITIAVIDQLRNADFDSNSIRTKVPERPVKLKLNF